MSDLDIEFKLPKNQAIVFFEFLSRFSEKNLLEIVDQAEERVLWDLLADLEKQLSEPFYPNYQELLEKARSEVRDEEF